MGGVEENAMGFQHGNESTNVSEMDISNVSMAKPTFLASSSAWDPIVSLSDQAQTFGGSSSMVSHNEFGGNNSSYPSLVLENQGMIHYMADMVPKVVPSYGGSGSFSDMMVGSFGQQHGDTIANNIGGYQPNYGGASKEVVGNERAVTNCEQSSQLEDSTTEEGGATGSAPGGIRRKRGLDHNSTFSPNKNAEGDELKDSPGKSCDGAKDQEKKLKVDQNTTSADLRGKQLVKQAKDNSQSGEAPKENFIHVRARRGQATNSHSLAERVRREKISERMRLLQELVPGCNKITGKAVMLDEIINYVQSLQQQVEFLSMKLATVNPELNLDVERILSKDILQSRIGHNIGGYGPGISTSHPFPNGTFQGTMAGFPSTSTHFPPLPQALLDHEFQSFYGMGYDSSTALDNLGPNGRLKTEL